jgi:hypothetical protein
LKYPWLIPQLRRSEENWDYLNRSNWSLGVMWVPVASALPWVCVGRNLRRSRSSAHLHVGFGETSPFSCLIHPTSFWDSVDYRLFPNREHLRLCVQLERLRETRFLRHTEDPYAVFKSLKPFKYTAMN